MACISVLTLFGKSVVSALYVPAFTSLSMSVELNQLNDVLFFCLDERVQDIDGIPFESFLICQVSVGCPVVK